MGWTIIRCVKLLYYKRTLNYNHLIYLVSAWVLLCTLMLSTQIMGRVFSVNGGCVLRITGMKNDWLRYRSAEVTIRWKNFYRVILCILSCILNDIITQSQVLKLLYINRMAAIIYIHTTGMLPNDYQFIEM